MFLIDGYNLLHVVARGKATSEARERLVAAVEAYCRQGGYRARIVFDATAGLRRREARGPVEVRTVAQGRTADEEILAALASTKDRTAYTVVSDDREILREAGRGRFKVLSCEEFARDLAAASPPPPEEGSAPPGDVDYWMREFGLDP